MLSHIYYAWIFFFDCGSRNCFLLTLLQWQHRKYNPLLCFVFFLWIWSNSPPSHTSRGRLSFAVVLTKSSALSGVVPVYQDAQISAETRTKQNKKNSRYHNGWHCWSKRLQRIWILLQRGVFLQSDWKGPAGISIITLIPWYQVEDGAGTGSFYLAWDWWLDWRVQQRRGKSSPPHREEKQCSTRLHIHYSKINLH